MLSDLQHVCLLLHPHLHRGPDRPAHRVLLKEVPRPSACRSHVNDGPVRDGIGPCLRPLSRHTQWVLGQRARRCVALSAAFLLGHQAAQRRSGHGESINQAFSVRHDRCLFRSLFLLDLRPGRPPSLRHWRPFLGHTFSADEPIEHGIRRFQLRRLESDVWPRYRRRPIVLLAALQRILVCLRLTFSWPRALAGLARKLA